MSKWNAEHQKGIEPTFLTRREGWGSEKTIFINEGGEGKSRRRLDQGMVAPTFLLSLASQNKSSPRKGI